MSKQRMPPIATQKRDARVFSNLRAAVNNEVLYQFDHQKIKVEGLNLKDSLADGKFTILKGGSFNPSKDTVDNLKRLAVRLHEIRSFFEEKHGKATRFSKDELPQDLLFDLVKNFIPGFNEGAVVKTKILDQKGEGYPGPIEEKYEHCYVAFNLDGTAIEDPNYPPPYTVFIDPYDLEFSLTPGSHLRGYDPKFRDVSRHLISQNAADLSQSSRVGSVFDGFYIDAAKQQAIHDEIKSAMAMEESLEFAQTAQEGFVAPEYTLTEGSIASLQKIMSRQKVRSPDSGFQSLYSQKGDGSFEEDLDQLISADGKRLVSICSPQGFEGHQDGEVTALSIAAMVNPLPEVVRSNNSDGRNLFNIEEVEFQRILIPLNKGGVHWDLLCIDVDRRSKKLTFSNITTDGIIYPAPKSIVDSVTIDGYEKENLLEPAYYYETGAQLSQNCGIATTLMMQDQMAEFLTGKEERSYNGFLDTFARLQDQLQEEKATAITLATIEDDSPLGYAEAIIGARKEYGGVSKNAQPYLSERLEDEHLTSTANAKKFIESNKVEFREIGFDIDDGFLDGRGIEDLQKMILKYYLVQAIYQPEMFRIIQAFDIYVRNEVFQKASDRSNLDEEDVEALANDIEKIAGNFDGRARGEIDARVSVQQIYSKYQNTLDENKLYQLFIAEFGNLDGGGRQTVYDYMLQCIDLADDRDKIAALKKLPSSNIRYLLLTSEDELKSHGRVTILDIFKSHILPFLNAQDLSVAIPGNRQELQADSLNVGQYTGASSAGVKVDADPCSHEEVVLAKTRSKELGGGKADTSALESSEQDAILEKFRLMSGGIWDESKKKELAKLYKVLEEKITQSKHLLKAKTVTIGFGEGSCYSCYLLGNDEDLAITTNLDHIALKSGGEFALQSDITNFINYTQRAIESIDKKVEEARVEDARVAHVVTRAAKGGGAARAHTAAGSKAAMAPEDPHSLRVQAKAIKSEIRGKIAEGMDIEPHPDISAAFELGKLSPANCRLNKLSGNADDDFKKTAKIFITEENLAILHDFFEERKLVKDKLGVLYKGMKFEGFVLRLMNKRYKEIYLDGRALVGRDKSDHAADGPVLGSIGSEDGKKARDFMDNLATKRDKLDHYKEYLTPEEMMLSPLVLPQAASVIIGTGSRSKEWGAAEVKSELDQSVDLALLSYPAAAEYRDGRTASYDLLFTAGFGGKDRYENHTAARKDKLKANAPLMKAAAKIYGQGHSLSKGALETVPMKMVTRKGAVETGHQLNIAAYKARTKNTLKLILLAADHDMKKYDLGTTFALKGVGMGAFSFTGSDQVFEAYAKEALQEVMSEITFNHIKKINLISWPSVFRSVKDKGEYPVYGGDSTVNGVQVVESNRPASLQKVAGEEAVAATVFCGDSGSLVGNEGNIGLARSSSDDPAMQYSMHDPELMDPYRNPFLNRAEAISVINDRGEVCGIGEAMAQKLEQDNFLTRLGFNRGVAANPVELLTALQYAWGVFHGAIPPKIGSSYDECKAEYLTGEWDAKTFGALAKNALLVKIKEVAPKAKFLEEYEDLMAKNAEKEMSKGEYEALRVEVRGIIAAAPVEELLMSKEERVEAEAKFVLEKSSGTIRAEQEAAERAKQKALADAAAMEGQRKVDAAAMEVARKDEAAALKAKQQAYALEALERSKQVSEDRLSVLNSYLKSSTSHTESWLDLNADISDLTAAIDKNQNNPNPEGPYRGAGIKSQLMAQGSEDNTAYFLQIEDIFLPLGSRFTQKESEDQEVAFGSIKAAGMIGGKITEVFVDGSYKTITDIVNESGAVESTLQQIAKIFHNPNSVKFKVETVESDEVVAGSVIEITCDNSRNSKSIFAPDRSASATSDFKTMSSMSDEKKLEILNGLSFSRGAPSSSPRGAFIQKSPSLVRGA